MDRDSPDVATIHNTEFHERGEMHYLNLQEGKRRARKVAVVFDSYWQDREHPYVGSRYEKTLRRTRVPCSCAMCGNPRRHFKGEDRLTLADKRQNDEVAAQMQSVWEG